MIKDILSVLFRWKQDIAIVFVAIVLFTTVFVFLAEPVYESDATVLLIPGRDRKPFLPDQASGPSYVGLVAEDITGEIKILTSYPVLKSVEERVHLEAIPEKKSWLDGLKKSFGSKTKISPEERAIAILQRNLSANPVTMTATISIRYRDASPERATEVVNTVVDAYITHHLKVFSNSGAASAIKFMGEEYNAKLALMEDSLIAFKTRFNIVNVDLEYQDIQKKLTEAHTKLLLLKRLDPEKITASDLANVTDDPTFAQLQTKLTDAELQCIELSSRYGREDGKVIAASNEIKELKRFIGQRIYISIEMWNQLVKKYQERFNDLEKNKPAINQLEREIEGIKQAYQLSNEKSNEVQINAAMDNAAFSSVRIIEYGRVANAPVFPHKKRIILLSIFFGLMAGVLFAFFRNFMSTHFYSVTEVELFTRKPVVASIPDFGNSGGENPLIAASRMLVPVADSLVAVPVISLILAPSRCDGASFITSAICHVLSQRPDNRVLRVDIITDQSMPLRAEKKFIITQDLTQDVIKEKIIISYSGKTDYLGVQISPLQIPGQKAIERFITLLKQSEYTHLFLDISANRADPLYLSFAPYASTIFPVVAYGRTKRFALLRMISQLQQYGHEIKGCVFNRRKNEIPEILYQWL